MQGVGNETTEEEEQEEEKQQQPAYLCMCAETLFRGFCLSPDTAEEMLCCVTGEEGEMGQSLPGIETVPHQIC